MTKNYNLNAAILCSLFVLAPATQAATYSYTNIDCAPTSYAYVTDINATGQITGFCTLGAFIRNGATLATFSVNNAPGNAMSINATGQVAGYSVTGTTPANSTGFVYDNGSITSFSGPSSSYTIGSSINASGQVTGFYTNPTGIHGYVYDLAANALTTIDAPGTTSTVPMSINDSSQITGYYGTGHGFIYSGGVFNTLDVSNTTTTMPLKINNNGEITGTYTNIADINSYDHGFVYSGGVVTTFDVPASIVTYPNSINDNGQVAGYYYGGVTGGARSFVRTGATIDLIDYPGATDTQIVSISNNGQVVGMYLDAAGALHGFLATPSTSTTPTPISFSPTLPNGVQGTAYSATLTASGGAGPFTYSATNLPAGLSITRGSNIVSGTPSVTGVYAVTITATDSTAKASSAIVVVTIGAPAISSTGTSCTVPKGANGGLNSKGKISSVSGSIITFITSKGASVSVNVPSCAKIEWNGGAKSFAIGQVFEWNGYNSAATGNVAQQVTIN